MQSGLDLTVNGGWRMRDEGAPHYIAMMDQTVYGHQQTLFIPITHKSVEVTMLFGDAHVRTDTYAGVSVPFVFNAELKPLRNTLFLMKQKDADEYAGNVVGGSEEDDVVVLENQLLRAEIGIPMLLKLC
ncbi:hypothetical protein PPTG_18007 [Phytophthora nicotianae INRA-310]|uniref:Uncharacterized protein n=1 Tax=Phytophthora nicotianae (strain INRA-310) TaxID=761204 RepID=W2PKJ8_PHYN3|nr:hypothetical protein PPTG_18007 [Phytophthora nicotianae INRA-310]ETN00565.1 hypothetical protein PPTG_18007 [Phytophthora nicotianae INRA-310]